MSGADELTGPTCPARYGFAVVLVAGAASFLGGTRFGWWLRASFRRVWGN